MNQSSYLDINQTVVNNLLQDPEKDFQSERQRYKQQNPPPVVQKQPIIKIDIKPKQQKQQQKKQVPKGSAYKFGQFSKYAVDKQRQINQKQQKIDGVIRQAMLSHLQKIKYYLKANEKLKEQSKTIQVKIQSLIGKQDNVYRMIKSPVQQFTKFFMDARHADKTAYQYIQHFVDIIFEIKHLRIVDGKIIDLNKYTVASIKESIDNNLLLQSTTNQNVYISVGQDRVGTSLYYYGGSLHTKNQLLSFTDEQRKIIISMVISFLKDQGIVTSQTQIIQGMQNHIQKAMQLFK